DGTHLGSAQSRYRHRIPDVAGYVRGSSVAKRNRRGTRPRIIETADTPARVQPQELFHGMARSARFDAGQSRTMKKRISWDKTKTAAANAAAELPRLTRAYFKAGRKAA